MRTTVTIDAELYREARRVTGLTERRALLNEGMRALIARESARRLAKLAGSDPNAKAGSRRRSKPPR